tara:strand:+ start:270 stop:794 length:525 start_codon:yes stop_codon:yes gene_type:complete
MGVELELIRGDITQVKADALVSAANSALRGGGGVDGAIHAAAGPKLLAACQGIGGCPTGSAVMTDAFNLEKNGVKHIIHAVGPIWQGGGEREPELLQSAYRTSLQLAEEAGLKTIAFPSISTGVYGFPLAQAAALALSVMREKNSDDESALQKVTFVLFDEGSLNTFSQAAAQI